MSEIYTRDIAEAIIDDFTNILHKYDADISGSASVEEIVHQELLERIEFRLKDICEAAKGDNPEIITGKLSGKI